MGLDADAIVVGGGLTGMAAAIAVARAGLSVIHVAPPAPLDRRTSALMQPSVDYLREAQLVSAPEKIGEPLLRIRIIDATNRLIRAPETLFDSRDAGVEAFGWNFPNTALHDVFAAAAEGLPNLEPRASTLLHIETDEGGIAMRLADGTNLRTALVIGADGKSSFVRRNMPGFVVREHQFEQAALVCDLELARPLDGTSVEFHNPDGPFTLVPAGGNRANLVWIDRREILDAARAGGPDALVHAFADKSMRLFGAVTPVTPTAVFPLSSIAVSPLGQNGVVLVGESAHAFPPIGAQGLNLGLRDVASLATVLASVERSRSDWALSASAEYSRLRQADVQRTGGMVDALFRSLLSQHLPAQALRAGGLWGLKSLPGLRRRAMGLGMGRPDT